MRSFYIVSCILFLLSTSSCNEPQTVSSDAKEAAAETQATTQTVRIPKEETPFAKEDIKTPVPVANKSSIQKRTVVKDSVNELRAQFVINDHIIDSLNSIVPVYDKALYNHLAVSYFSALADSLHGKSYFADNSDGVMLSIMDILTSRLNEGTDLVFLVDKTGSMDDDIAMVKNSLNLIMDYLAHFKNVKVGMAFYGDKNFHYDMWYNRVDLTNNLNDIRDFMSVYSTINNSDVPESVNDGIVRTVEEMNWTKGNRRLMMVIGDAHSQVPPYSGYSQSQVIRKCDSMNVKFNLYPIIISSTLTNLEPMHNKSDFAKVYPNPATDYCYIKLPGTETIYYDVVDMTGRKWVSSTTTSTGITIPVTEIPGGSYLIQVYNQDYSNYYSKPLIIQH